MSGSTYVKLSMVIIAVAFLIEVVVSSCTSKDSYTAEDNLPREDVIISSENVVPAEEAPVEQQQKADPEKSVENTFFFTKSDSDINAAVDTALDELVNVIGEFQKRLQK